MPASPHCRLCSLARHIAISRADPIEATGLGGSSAADAQQQQQQQQQQPEVLPVEMSEREKFLLDVNGMWRGASVGRAPLASCFFLLGVMIMIPCAKSIHLGSLGSRRVSGGGGISD